MNPLPKPIADRIGHIGGIETLVLDERILFFGFDYSGDLVVSPLIGDIDVMAQFASCYMEQLDGTHDADYWRELAQTSIVDSALCSSLESRSFSSTQLAATAAAIAQAAQNGIAVSDLSIEYHLLYLLGAAGGWEAQSVGDIEEFISQLSGREAQPSGQTLYAVASELQDALCRLIGAAPDNWKTQFASLCSA